MWTTHTSMPAHVRLTFSYLFPSHITNVFISRLGSFSHFDSCVHSHRFNFDFARLIHVYREGEGEKLSLINWYYYVERIAVRLKTLRRTMWIHFEHKIHVTLVAFVLHSRRTALIFKTKLIIVSRNLHNAYSEGRKRKWKGEREKEGLKNCCLVLAHKIRMRKEKVTFNCTDWTQHW